MTKKSWALISDTHGVLPDPELLKDASVVLHAGDIGPDQNVKDWQHKVFCPWLEQLQGLGVQFYGTYGNHDNPQWWKPYSHQPVKGQKIVVDSLVAIEDELVWFSPWSVTFGSWAWMSSEGKLALKYDKIPDSTTMIVSHTPMYRDLGGMTLRGEEAGSVALRYRVEQLLAGDPGDLTTLVCGHIHEGYGRYDLDGLDIINAAQMDLNYVPGNPIQWKAR